jgi:hypothetical protein
MFGNKFAGDDIAREFLKIMGEEKFSSFKKEASEETQESDDSPGLQSEASAKPEDFLVAPEEGAAVSSAIDSKIAEMEDDDMENCADCGEPMSSGNHDHGHESDAVDYMMDKASQEVFEGLGKIVASLRAKNENFAADVVAATAVDIRDDLIKEAARKAFVLESLTKMASNLRKEDDTLAADMVEVTIQKIKAK